jgi:hypothetical protein
VTINLLSNALKFSKQGGFVEVSSEIVREEGKKFIKVTVKDNGMGIRKEDKPKLFNLFGKVKQKSSSLNREGIGFGLTICKQICQEFGGYIDFDSIEDIGSKFFFTFQIFDNRDTSFVSMNSDVLSSINAENSVYELKNWGDHEEASDCDSSIEAPERSSKKLLLRNKTLQKLGSIKTEFSCKLAPLR